MSNWFEKHHAVLSNAVKATVERGHWAAFAEMPSEKIYGEGSKKAGESAFLTMQNQPFKFSVPQTDADFVAGEKQSPYGIKLGVQYPQLPVEILLKRADSAQRSWRRLDIETRIGVCIEMLYRLADKSFLMAHAVMHTTGQPFVMSFQAGGAHALDRGLEAVAYAYQALTANDVQTTWTKTIGKNRDGEPIIARLDKQFHTRGRGVGLVIGCSTFPTWNSYPGIFANLATGNSVVVKPSDSAILPLAIAVDVMRSVLDEAGIDPEVVQLAVSAGDNELTQTLAQDARVKMIDYTGGPSFGKWLQENCPNTQLYLELAGINNIFIESTDDVKGMVNNIGFSLSLYGGQMCTAPQNIYVPKDGIDTPDGKLSFDDVVKAIADSVSKLLSDNNRAFSILGAISSDAISVRIGEAVKMGKIALKSEQANYDAFPNARTAKPLLITLANTDQPLAQSEQFGPIAFIIACDDRDAALSKITRSIEEHGAMTTSLYSTNDTFKSQVISEVVDAGSPLSVNLTGGIYVNQSAAYSDFHGSALNPAANTTLTDLGFVAKRFGWVTVREQQA